MFEWLLIASAKHLGEEKQNEYIEKCNVLEKKCTEKYECVLIVKKKKFSK